MLSQVGFSAITPRISVEQIKTALDSKIGIVQSEIDTLRRSNEALTLTHASIESNVNALVKFDCLDAKISARDKTLAGLKCN